MVRKLIHFFHIRYKQRQTTRTGTLNSPNRCWFLCTIVPETFSPLVALLKSHICYFRLGFCSLPLVFPWGHILWETSCPSPHKKVAQSQKAEACNLLTLLCIIYQSHKENAVYSELISKLFSVWVSEQAGLCPKPQSHPQWSSDGCGAGTEWHSLQASYKSLL